MRAPYAEPRTRRTGSGEGAFFALHRVVTRRLQRDLDRRTRRRARARAIERFAWLHPLPFRSYFDASFVGRLPEDLCGRDAAAIAEAWSRQFHYRDQVRRQADQVTMEPVAATFLGLVEDEERRLAH